MTILSDESKEWLEYLVKLNNRLLSKQQFSGFTSYAILALIGVLLYKIVNGMTIISEIQINELIVSFTNTLNVGITISGFYRFLIALYEPAQPSRLHTWNSTRKDIYTNIIGTLHILLVTICNFYVFNNTLLNNRLARIIHMVFSGVFGLIVFIMLIAQVFENKQKKKIKDKLFSDDVEPPVFRQMSPSATIYPKSFAIVMALIIATMLSGSFYSYLHNAIRYLSSENIAIIIVPAELYVVFALLNMYIKNDILLKNNVVLLNLEKRIIAEALPAEEIRKVFINEYIGGTAHDWIEGIRITINGKYKEILGVINNAEKKLEEFKKTITNKDLEELEPIAELRKELYDVLQEYVKFVSGKTDQLRYALKNFKYTLSFELDMLDQLNREWIEQVVEIEVLYKSFFKECDDLKNSFHEEE